MDPMNKVKIRYNFRTKLKGEVTRSQGGVPRNQPPRGGTRNKKLLTNLLKKNKKAA